MEGQVYTRHQYWGNFEKKEAEVGDIMPVSMPQNAKPDRGAKSVIPKVAAESEVGLPEGVEEDAVSGEQPEKNPQAKPINPRVSVEGKEPPKLIKEKEAQAFAMPSLRRYPIDSYDQVKQAAVYFGAFQGQFTPAHRREYCTNLVKRASVLGIEMPEDVRLYSGDGPSSPDALELAFSSRRSVLTNDDHVQLLNKLAEAQPTLLPEEFSAALSEFDKLAELDHLYATDVLDPVLSAFGKTAEEDVDGSHVIGNEVVYNHQLMALSRTPCTSVAARFGDDFVKEFKKDPVGIFKSLPIDQKKVIGREANEPRVAT